MLIQSFLEIKICYKKTKENIMKISLNKISVFTEIIF